MFPQEQPSYRVPPRRSTSSTGVRPSIQLLRRRRLSRTSSLPLLFVDEKASGAVISAVSLAVSVARHGPERDDRLAGI